MAGVSRTTIDNYIADGKLSAERNGNKTVIDVSELERVFGKLVAPETVKPARPSLQTDTSQVASILQLQIERLERQLDATLQEQAREREAHRQEREKLLSIIEKQTYMLAAPKEPPAAPQEPESKEPEPREPEPKKSFWRRIIL